MSAQPDQEKRRGSRTGWALPILIAAVLLVGIFQVVGAVQDHFGLAHEWAAQQPAVTQGVKLRKQLRALAGQTAELAKTGDVGARIVLAYMHREGVTVKPPMAPSKK